MKKMRINGIWLGAFLTMMSAAAYAQNPTAIDERWGDQGDGTFANPVLNADYSDPDVIRVGNKYYDLFGVPLYGNAHSGEHRSGELENHCPCL